MATILLIGTDGALLEGLVQLLSGSGHTAHMVHTLEEGRELAALRPPLAVLVETRIALAESDAIPTPMARGGAVLLYRTDDSRPTLLPPTLQRSVLADLSLPLERHRLLTLIQCMADRALATGRREWTSEHHPR